MPGAFVTDTFFQVLGTRSAVGRLLTEDDDRPDSSVVVLGYRTWQRWFAGSPAALGESIVVGGRHVQIIGVAPDRFTGRGSWISQGPDDVPQVWLPMAIAPDVPLWSALQITARLAPGSTRHQVRADLATIVSAVEGANGRGRDLDIRVRDFVLGESADNPIDLAALVAAAGIFAVMSYTVTLRRREIAIRIAVGAGSGHAVRLVITQALRLTATGTLLGLGAALPLAFLLRSALLGLSPVDPIALSGSIGVLFAAALAASLIPAWRAASVSPLIALRADE